MSDGFYSVFDGLPQLSIPEVSSITQEKVTVEVVTNTIFIFQEATPVKVENDLRDMIVAKAKLTNRITEDLVKKYHESFLCLYKAAKHRIKDLEQEIFQLKNPLRAMKNVVEFKPKDMTINPEMTQYIIQAMNEGKELADVLPPGFLLQ